MMNLNMKEITELKVGEEIEIELSGEQIKVSKEECNNTMPVAYSNIYTFPSVYTKKGVTKVIYIDDKFCELPEKYQRIVFIHELGHLKYGSLRYKVGFFGNYEESYDSVIMKETKADLFGVMFSGATIKDLKKTHMAILKTLKRDNVIGYFKYILMKSLMMKRVKQAKQLMKENFSFENLK